MTDHPPESLGSVEGDPSLEPPFGTARKNSLANRSAIIGRIVSTMDLKKVKPSDLFWSLVMTSFLINNESISRMVS